MYKATSKKYEMQEERIKHENSYFLFKQFQIEIEAGLHLKKSKM